MTKKQAKVAAKAMHTKIANAFDNNGMDCKELFKVVENEALAIGLGRLMIQASWQHWDATGRFEPCFARTAYCILLQCYLRQKPKRKTKAKK